MTGVKMVHVPYKAVVDAQVDLMGGRIQVMFTDFTSSVPLIKAGKMRALGVTTQTRAAAMPDLAPIAELGVPGFNAAAWQMVVAPSATPRLIVDKLHDAIEAIMARPETRVAITIGLVPAEKASIEQLQAFVRSGKSFAGAKWSSARAHRSIKAAAAADLGIPFAVSNLRHAVHETVSVSGARMDTELLIAGAGPVGLTLSIDLGKRGIPCTLIEKNDAPLGFPKMERCNPRTMEIFRRLGLAEAVRAAGYPPDWPMDAYLVFDLMHPPLMKMAHPTVAQAKAKRDATTDGSLPLEPYQIISQYTLEPLLKSVAEQIPDVTVKFGHELQSFEQDFGGTTTQVRKQRRQRHNPRSLSGRLRRRLKCRS